MSAEHTPGPWYIDGGFVYSARNREAVKAAKAKDRNCGYGNIPITKVIADLAGEHQANARLIAAAPELYADGEHCAMVLREMANILRGHNLAGCGDICDAAALKLENTLAKARWAAQ